MRISNFPVNNNIVEEGRGGTFSLCTLSKRFFCHRLENCFLRFKQGRKEVSREQYAAGIVGLRNS